MFPREESRTGRLTVLLPFFPQCLSFLLVEVQGSLELSQSDRARCFYFSTVVWHLGCEVPSLDFCRTRFKSFVKHK